MFNFIEPSLKYERRGDKAIREYHKYLKEKKVGQSTNIFFIRSHPSFLLPTLRVDQNKKLVTRWTFSELYAQPILLKH
jgi:hypothetical protein